MIQGDGKKVKQVVQSVYVFQDARSVKIQLIYIRGEGRLLKKGGLIPKLQLNPRLVRDEFPDGRIGKHHAEFSLVAALYHNISVRLRMANLYVFHSKGKHPGWFILILVSILLLLGT